MQLTALRDLRVACSRRRRSRSLRVLAGVSLAAQHTMTTQVAFYPATWRAPNECCFWRGDALPLASELWRWPRNTSSQHMDQTSSRAVQSLPAFRLNRFLLIAGLALVAAAFTPAGHVRLLGNISFIRLPTAGVAFVTLGLLTSLMALRPRGWWRWIPGIAAIVLLAVVYTRLRWAPSGGFFDPVLRRAVRPAWGFVPMTLAALLMLGAAASVRRDPHASLSGRPDER